MAITKHAAYDETLQQIRLRTMNINSVLSTGNPLDPPPIYGSPTSKHAAYDETLQEILALTASIDEIVEQGGGGGGGGGDIPTMSADTKGGAKLGDGLVVNDDKLQVGDLVKESSGSVYGPLASVTAKGWSEQNGTPTPDNPVPIQVVRGRNLLPITTLPTYSGLTFTRTDDNGIKFMGTPSASGTVTLWSDTSNPLVIASEGILSIGVSKSGDYEFRMRTTSDTVVNISNGQSSVAIPAGTYKACEMYVVSSKTYNVTLYPQLNLGSTPQPYVSYGHVGLDVTIDGVTTTTPIPLPQRGWVAGLPDGTADVLRIDSAGKVTWELADKETVFDGSSDEEFVVNGGQANLVDRYFQTALSDCNTSKTEWLISNLSPTTLVYGADTSNAGKIGFMVNGANLRFRPFELDAGGSTNNTEAISYLRTWLSTHNITVLYPLATPVTEDCGYVDLPEIPSDATVSIPELEAFNCTFWVDSDGSILMLSKQYHERTAAEIEAATEAATTEVLGSVAPIEGSTASTNYSIGDYLVFNNKLCKVTNAIATGETIAIGTNVVTTTVAAEILAMQE